MIDPPIGPWIPQALLGRGAHGIVWRCRHAETGASAAVKRASALRGRAARALRRELEVLASLPPHPGLARILDHGLTDEGALYVATELVAGVPLRSLLSRVWPRTRSASTWSDEEEELLPPEVDGTPDGAAVDALLGHLRTACRTLAWLHGEGVVHLDVKPDNLLVGDDGAAVLVDLGIARPNAHGTREVVDVDHLLAGTAAYMSPEQIRGEPVDARADLYAVGCVLYEILGGRVPFEGPRRAVLEAHLHATPDPLPPTVPPALDRLTRALLAKDPAQRPGHADEVARALGAPAAAAEGPPVRPILYLPRLCGRELLVAEVRAHLQGGRVPALLGEGGVGKSRVAGEVARLARLEGKRVAAGEPVRAAPGNPPLSVLHRPLQALTEAGGETLDPEQRGLLAALVPGLAGLGAPRPPSGSGAEIRDQILDAVDDALGVIFGPEGGLLVLEDLQWADGLSLGWLARRVAAGPGPLRILCTARSDELPSGLLPAEVVAVPVDLLPPAEVAAVVRSMLAAPDLDPAVVDAIVAVSGGNAWLAGEATRTAAEQGLVVRAAAGWQANPAAASPRVRPAALEERVTAGLGGLSASERSLAEALSVLGRRPDDGLLAAVHGLSPAPGVVRELRRRAILADDGSGLIAFRHDRYRERVAAGLDPDRRTELHRRAADHLEGGDSFAERAAHLELAGQPEAALRCWGRAAESAQAAGLYEEEVRCRGRAIAVAGEDRASAWEHELALANALSNGGDPEGAIARYEQAALGVCDRTRRAVVRAKIALVLSEVGRVEEAVAAAAAAADTDDVGVLYDRARALFWCRRFDEGAAIATEALTRAGPERPMLLGVLAAIERERGRLDASRAALLAARELAPAAWIEHHLAVTDNSAGRMADALVRLQQLLDAPLPRRVRQLLAFDVAAIRIRLGQRAEADTELRRLLAEPRLERRLLGSCHVGLAELALLDERPVDALAHLERSEPDLIGPDVDLALAEAWLALGALDTARAALARVHGASHESGRLRLAARIAAAEGDPAAIELAGRALAVARAGGSGLDEVDGGALLARLHLASGEPADARRCADEVYALAVELSLWNFAVLAAATAAEADLACGDPPRLERLREAGLRCPRPLLPAVERALQLAAARGS